MEILQQKLGDRLLRDEIMSRYTAARLGGKADWLYIARDSIEELAEVTMAAWSRNIPVCIIGGGANILVSDKGIRGLVIVNRVANIEFGDWHNDRSVSATAGTNLSTFAQRCQLAGLSGMEWAVSIPGTVGGAIINNAGAHGGDMAACVADVVVLQPEGPKLYSNNDLQFAYRNSLLKSQTTRQYVVLLATFTLSHDDPDMIKSRMMEFTAHRKKTQPPGASLGSIFKNPPGDYAGRLIEAAGLKSFRIGNAVVSPVHANFFVNVGEASATDYHDLIRHVQKRVYEKSGVQLEAEIELLGEW